MIAYRQIQKIDNQYCVFTVIRKDERSCGEIIVEILDELPFSYRLKGVLGKWGKDMESPQSTGEIGMKGLRWFAFQLETYIEKVWDTNFGLYCHPIDARRANVFFRVMSKLGFERYDDEEEDGSVIIMLNPVF